MAIILNDNLKINVGKPIDSKYLNGLVSYVNEAEVNSVIPIGERYIGLTVNVTNVEYWYETGVADIDLVIKKAPPSSDTFVSGATLNGSILELQRSEGQPDVTVELSGLTGLSDRYVTGATYGGAILSLQRSQGLPDVTVSIGVSGVTDGVVSGGTLSGTTLILERTIGLSDVIVDLSALSGGTGGGNDQYTGVTPSNIEVGGMVVGTELTGRTYTSLFQEILIAVFTPTFVNPNNTFGDDATNTQEVGITAGTINFSATFDQGLITPQYPPTSSPFRSGLPNTYNYTGTGLPATAASTSLSDNQLINNYTILLGANTWTNTVSYDAGVQPYDSNGDPFDSPLPAGTTSSKSTTITGRYIRFYGANATTPANSAQVRALPSSAFQTANVNVFSLNTGSALTKFVVALPPSRTISSVIDVDALGANITSQYILQGTINVQDGGGSGSIQTYNLYEMNVGSPYATSHNHEITTA